MPTEEVPTKVKTPPDRIEYRPNAYVGLAFAVIFAATAAILGWLGLILAPSDRAALDGGTLLLFSAIPFRPFCWTAAVVFVLLGYGIARRALRDKPTLMLSEENLTLHSGKTIPWRRVVSANVNRQDLLLVEFEAHEDQPRSPPMRPKWIARFWRAQHENQLILSAFELGADPAEVAKELQGRISPDKRPSLA